MDARPAPLVNGGAALERAREAWAQSEFDVAETAYQEALDRGGLTRTETVECYAHLGAAHYITGHKDRAAAAFHIAAVIDPAFVVPPEAGKKATAIADKERKRAVTLTIDLTSPVKVEAGTAFAITVNLDAAQMALISRVGLFVRDPSTSKVYRFEETPQSAVHFRVPASMTLPGASLDVTVQVLDAHDNELATNATRVLVRGVPAVATTDQPIASGSFWKSPWPYLIGGALLAAGGGVGLYFALKPPTDVNIGAPRVQAN